MSNSYNHVFTPAMHPADNHERDLRDDVSKIVLEQILIGEREKPTSATLQMVVKATFEYVDAFMRERYERESIARSEMQANIPDHLGQLNL